MFRPSPSMFLLHRDVRTNLPGPEEPKVVPLSSGRPQLFGFDGDDEVEDPGLSDLVLEAHLAAAPDLSFLALRGGSLFTCINTVDKKLIVISSTFPGNHHREVFIIFDTIDRSLRIIPAVPRSLRLNRTNRVLAVRKHGDERSYALVIPGQAVTSVSDKGLAEWQDVLFISPSSSTSPFASPSSSTSMPSPPLPWQLMKKANIPKLQLNDNFFADEVFSFCGHGYWADLLFGVLYCNCADVLSDSVDTVDFHFVKLPPPYLGSPLGRDFIAELRAFRTMACVGGTIKFVSIDGFILPMNPQIMKHRYVKVWTLTGDFKWLIEDKLSMGDLWRMPGFLKIQSLFSKYRSLAPMYPFLSTKEDRVIYFALGEVIQGHSSGSFPITVHFLLRVDMILQDLSFIRIPGSQRPTMQNYFGVDHSILCPPVALAGDGKSKGKVRGLQAKMRGLKV
ncbi:unnamed protein product [Alopecurus aequalis]